MKEAFRLLKRSIISVESESVLLEEIDEDDLEAAPPWTCRGRREAARRGRSGVAREARFHYRGFTSEAAAQEKSKSTIIVRGLYGLPGLDHHSFTLKGDVGRCPRLEEERGGRLVPQNACGRGRRGDRGACQIAEADLKRLQKDDLVIVVAHEDNEPVLAVHPNVDVADASAA